MNWLHSLWFGYGWSSDKGNGPEALQQTLLYGAIAIALVPPIRHWAARHVESIKQHIEQENAHIHAKLNHVILNSKSIPNEVPGLPDKHQPKGAK